MPVLRSLKKVWLFVVLPVFALGCQKTLQNDILIYQNDFESGNLEGISGGVLMEYEGSQVIGNYNKGGFSLHLNDLPDHHFIVVAFDLLIHDTWDGNNTAPDGPDRWTLEVNHQLTRSDNDFFETTFSNSVCTITYCLMQSFPAEFPNLYNPKSGATQTLLPGLCSQEANPKGTTLYQIEKVFSHKDNALILRFFDQLIQSNISDEKCDESWSLDNLSVRVLEVD